MARTGSRIRSTWWTTASPDVTTNLCSTCPTTTPRRARLPVGTSSCTSVAVIRAGRRARAGDVLTSRPPGLLAHLNIIHGCTSVPLGVRDDVPNFERRRSLMRHTIGLTLAAALVGLAAVACTEGTAPSSDQAQVLAAESDQLGAMVDTDFGVAGAAATSASTDPAASSSASAGTGSGADTAPTFWGRLRVVPGGPRPIYHRDVTIQGDTARVEHDITFNGILLVDTSADGVFDPTS